MTNNLRRKFNIKDNTSKKSIFVIDMRGEFYEEF